MKKAAKIERTFFGLYQVNNYLSRPLPKMLTIFVDSIAEFFLGIDYFSGSNFYSIKFQLKNFPMPHCETFGE